MSHAAKPTLPMNRPVAAGILPAVEPRLPARRNGQPQTSCASSAPDAPEEMWFFPGGETRALHGRQDACHYNYTAHGAHNDRGILFPLPHS